MTEKERVRIPKGFTSVQWRDNKVTRKRLETLERRLAHLGQRVSGHRGESSSWDEEERAALGWAIPILEKWVDDEPLFEYDWSSEMTETASLQDFVNYLGTELRHNGERCELVGVRFIHEKPQRPVLRMTLKPLETDEEPQRKLRKNQKMIELEEVES